METQHPEIYRTILDKRELTDEIKKQLTAALEEFKGRFSA
jgi:F0F1-type ATP synthase alpha subunit